MIIHNVQDVSHAKLYGFFMVPILTISGQSVLRCIPKIELVKFYLAITLIILTHRQCVRHFHIRIAPGRNPIAGMVNRRQKESSVQNISIRSSGKKTTARAPECVSKAEEAIFRSPKNHEGVWPKRLELVEQRLKRYFAKTLDCTHTRSLCARNYQQ